MAVAYVYVLVDVQPCYPVRKQPRRSRVRKASTAAMSRRRLFVCIQLLSVNTGGKAYPAMHLFSVERTRFSAVASERVCEREAAGSNPAGEHFPLFVF